MCEHFESPDRHIERALLGPLWETLARMRANSLPLSPPPPPPPHPQPDPTPPPPVPPLCDLAKTATLSSDFRALKAAAVGMDGGDGGDAVGGAGGREGAVNEARGVRVSAEAILSWRCGSLRRGALPALMWKGARWKGRSREAYAGGGRHSEGFPSGMRESGRGIGQRSARC